MSGKATVACPYCGDTGTYSHGIKRGDGSTYVYCKKCKKRFKLIIRKGAVHEVKKQ